MNRRLSMKTYFLQFLVVVSFNAMVYTGSAQELVYLKDSASVPEYGNKPLKQYEKMACKAAKNKALADEFGTSVAKNYEKITEMVNARQYSVGEFSRFQAVYENTFPNGIWVKNADPPRIKEYEKRKNWWMKCVVEGYGRKRSAPKVNFKTKALDGTNIKIDESVHFSSGENFYLYFETPEPGYLLVVYTDFDKVYKILPYEKMNKTKLKVSANVPYLFFNSKKKFGRKYLGEAYKATQTLTGESIYKVVDEIKLATHKNTAFEQAIVIFSEKDFNAPLFGKEGKTVDRGKTPDYIKRKAFMDWLQQQRVHQEGLQVEKIGIIIRNS